MVSVVPLREIAFDVGENYYTVRGFALGRGYGVYRVDRALVVSRPDAALIRAFFADLRRRGQRLTTINSRTD